MAMSAVLDGVLTIDEAFDDAMSFCLQCRACEAVCPGLVPFGRVMEGARAELDVQRPSTRRRARKLVLGSVLPSRFLISAVTFGAAAMQRMRLGRMLPAPIRRSFSGLRPLGRRASWLGREVLPSGASRGTIGLLAGCVMDDWFGPVHDATVGVLTAAGYRVVVPKDQTCCGALAAHDGHVDVARRLATANADAFSEVDLVVSDSAGCTAHLKEYDHWAGPGLGAKTRDVTELVAELIASGELPTIDIDRGPVAVQDPCHLRHAQRITAAPRSILAAAGYMPVEIDPDGLCCGAAGIYSILHPETSHDLGIRKAAQVRASGAPVVSSANPGCEMQLRAHLEGKIDVAHPVELYWQALLESSSQPSGGDRISTTSERREHH
jgi:glycolate oxidase iron-sulfur subunit